MISYKAKSHKDHGAERLTAENINDWFNNHKNDLFKHLYVVNEPGYVCVCYIACEKW